MPASTEKILSTLAKTGLLLKQDKMLPNVVTLVTGESLKGSWWSHPKSHEIFAILMELADHPDVLICKLLGGKDTLVHRKLWPVLLAVAREDAPWQTRGLSAPARRLLAQARDAKEPLPASGPAVMELQRRLLLHAEEIHTPSGKHALAVETWQAWARRKKLKPLASPEKVRAQLEAAARTLGAPISALPWTDTQLPARIRRKIEA